MGYFHRFIIFGLLAELLMIEENNDTLQFKILYHQKTDFSLWNSDGETPLMIAVALKQRKLTKVLHTYHLIDLISSYWTISVGCDPSRQININQ